MLNGADPTRLGDVRDGIGAQDMPSVVASPLRLLAGWEFSIGPDKTFSALWAIADGETRDMLLAIHREVCAAMVRVLDSAAYLRRGAGGKQWQHAPGVLCAPVTHTTSRTGDPQLHDHFLIANIAQAPDGKWLTLDGQLIYDMMQFAVTMYGRTLRHLATQRLELTWTRPDDNGHRPHHRGTRGAGGAVGRALQADQGLHGRPPRDQQRPGVGDHPVGAHNSVVCADQA